MSGSSWAAPGASRSSGCTQPSQGLNPCIPDPASTVRSDCVRETQSRAARSRHPLEHSIREGTHAGGSWRRSPRWLETVPRATFARNAGRKQLRAGTDLELGASELAPQTRDTMWRVWEQKRRLRRGFVRPGVLLALLRTATWRATTVLASDCANQLLAAWGCTFASMRS